MHTIHPRSSSRVLIVLAAALVLSWISVASAQTGSNRSCELGLTMTSLEDVVFDANGAQNAFFDFCARLHGADPAAAGHPMQPVTHLFLAAREFLQRSSDDLQHLRAFIRAAHAHGITVEYIDGAPEWVTRDAGDADQVMLDVFRFDQQGAPDERFSGFIFDVGPEGWTQWYSAAARPKLLALLRMGKRKAMGASDAARIGVTIPRWYYGRLGRDAFVELLSNADVVMLDDYVDQESSLINSLTHETAIADSFHIPIFARILAGPNMNPSITFIEEGWLALEHAVTTVCSTFAESPMFQGVVVNDYQSYRDLNRSRHSLAVGLKWIPQRGRPLAALMHDSGDVFVLDPIGDSGAVPKKNDLNALQRSGPNYREVFATVPWEQVVLCPPGQHAFCTGRSDLKKRMSRILTAGMDGIVVDLAGSDTLAEMIGRYDADEMLVAAIDTVSYVLRDMLSHPAAPVVVRHAEQLLAECSDRQFARLLINVDGEIVELPGPVFWRARNSVFSRMRN